MLTETPARDDAHQRALDWIAAGPKEIWIDGKWQQARSGKFIDSINPETEEKLTAISDADASDIDRAVMAARKAFEAPSWSAMTPHERTNCLLRIANIVEANAAELAVLESLDNGMPLWYSKAGVNAVVNQFRYYAGWPTKMFGATNPSTPDIFNYTLREPIGVCGQIIAWNVPLVMASMKIANALACGNTVVLKPAELASFTTLRLAELIGEADIPAGVVNIVTGLGAGAGAAIASHPGIDKIAFTGSTAVGKHIMRAAADTMKKVTLELGGKSPNIIFPDADIDKALEFAVRSFCGNSGQVCSASTRVLVHQDLHDEIAARVADMASAYKVGSPFDPETKLGPLVSGTQRDRVMGYIEAGIADGATLSFGGSRLGGKGYFVQPTVFSNVDNKSKIAQEEIFGPVVTIIPFKDEADAIQKANDTTYGLAGAVWSRDFSRATRVAKAIKAGRIFINSYGDADPVMAFGGYKQSGLGREYGQESIDMYTQTKSVWARL
ncbi:aldehyde dehydrogenase [Hyphomonas sp. ND6WE1B]|uniref:aldehyde dehydrogenase family protein n=1 Tax=Hyphomonas sp. ND6WE1B TaxID=1848191 RepID=UPI000807611D|nr:aldehyde dehydrogenase family protein [Hyphomonas sp. ND6WE1B]